METKESARECGDLRLQAEKILQEKRTEVDKDWRDLPPEEVRRLLHELRVHQIELKMQNEELQRIQLELEASRAEYFDLYELAPAGYLILDQHGLIRKANLTAARLFGVGRRALIGEPLARFIARDDQDGYYLQYKKLLKTGGEKAFEMGMIRAGGARFWVRLEMVATGDNEEEPPRCRAVLIDITERKQAEEALRKSEQQLNSELGAAEILHDFSTQLIQAGNVETLYEKILETLKAMLHSDYASLRLFHPERGEHGQLELLGHCGFDEEAAIFWKSIDLDSRSICSIAAKERQRIVVTDIMSSDVLIGSDHLQMLQQAGIRAVQSTPLISRTGTVLGVFSTHWHEPHRLTKSEIRSLDVLARQVADLIESSLAKECLDAAIEELREADRRKDEFLGVLSHEIRNPLASIMLCLNLLERAEPGGEQTARARKILGRQTAQLSRLVDDLLDVTRIKRNKIELHKEQVELNELMHRTAEDYQALFQENGVMLEVQPSPAELYVEADPARLAQVVGNLLHNAAKFTEPGGLTRLCVAKDERRQRALISVADNGAGMSLEMQKNLFIPFMQADTSLDRNGAGGLGLGLALVKGLTELHGGEVHARSDGPGKGSVFTVCLPLSTKPLSIRVDAPVTEICPGQGRRVLVIEDIVDVADSLKLLLVEEGHEVMVAYDGLEGIAVAKKFHPDVLLCDIGLPGIDGYQVARAFRADNDLKNVYLVSLTGYARPEDIEKAKEAGFNHQLAKPVELEKIKKVVIEKI